MGCSFYPLGVPRPIRPCLSQNVFLDVILERKTGITKVPFGRPKLSIGRIGTTFNALLNRHGPVGPSFQGMPEKFDFHDAPNIFVHRVSGT